MMGAAVTRIPDGGVASQMRSTYYGEFKYI